MLGMGPSLCLILEERELEKILLRLESFTAPQYDQLNTLRFPPHSTGTGYFPPPALKCKGGLLTGEKVFWIGGFSCLTIN